MTDVIRKAMQDSPALRWAVEAAKKSGCGKSMRGVVIWRPGALQPLVTGTNAPPGNIECARTKACREACSKLCVHAEAAALRALAGRLHHGTRRLHLLHVKIVGGQPVASQRPSCCSCSALIMAEPSIVSVWLLQADGLREYEPREFHRLSLLANGHNIETMGQEQGDLWG